MLCSEFHAAYSVVEVSERTLEHPPLREFRSANDAATEPCIDAFVCAASDHRWLGRFYGRRGDANALVHTPTPDSLLVVAGGIPYWVPAKSPEEFKVVGFQPVRAVHCAPGAGLLVLEGYTSLVALGRTEKPVWQSPRLVSDGFAEVRLTSSDIWVRGYSAPCDDDIERRLELASGSIA